MPDVRYPVQPSMNGGAYPRLSRFFRGLLALRWGIVAGYAIVVPFAVTLAMRVGSDNSLDRLIVQSDPDYVATREFAKVFPDPDRIVLLAEAEDPFAPAVLDRVEEIQRRLASVPGVSSVSALDIFARAKPGLAGEARAAAFRAFATGTTLLGKQGLVGPDFLGIPVEFDAATPGERDAVLAGIDAVLAPIDRSPAPLLAVRRIGGPYVDAYLEQATGRASVRYFVLFGIFVVALNLFLYRSKRTLAAFLITLAATVALSVAFAWAVGYVFTIVSALVPLTVLVTSTASLVYLQSRFVENPGGDAFDEHQVFTLSNKLLATTASIFAAAVGFAALAVSGIRPIREMGLWTAAGLVIAWITAFTLFPALQRILRTPMQHERKVAAQWFVSLIEHLPGWSYRWRWRILPATVVVMAVGLAALTGIPGVVEPMTLETEALDYIDKKLPIYHDTRRFEDALGGLSVTRIWVKTPEGRVLDPEILRGLHGFARRLEADARVGSVNGPTDVLRWARYVQGRGDRLPDDDGAWPKLAADLEQILLGERALRGTVDLATLSSTQVSFIARGRDFPDVDSLRGFVEKAWADAAARYPALAPCRAQVVGEGLLQAKIAHYLVPTLAESFALTAAIIFVTFLLIFRNGAARLMAMIPSLFAILAMFLVMRLLRIPLNVATILIASTVLGASENDQIHFFYHFQEKRNGATTEEAMRHALLIAGRAILFATLINAGGFLALALSDLPPMRQFGIIAASAFLLSMLAAFVAMPASLWIFFRERPDL